MLVTLLCDSFVINSRCIRCSYIYDYLFYSEEVVDYMLCANTSLSISPISNSHTIIRVFILDASALNAHQVLRWMATMSAVRSDMSRSEWSSLMVHQISLHDYDQLRLLFVKEG